MEKNQTKFDRDKYNNKICDMVQECVNELFDLAKKHNIDHIDFKKHHVYTPTATFNDDNGLIKWSEVIKIEFKLADDILDSEDAIIIRSKDQSAYLDRTYGDYFDVEQSLPHIYAAVIDCLEDGLRKDELLPTCIKTYQIQDGYEVVPSEVTCKIENGIGIHLVGLPDKAVKETLLRVVTALTSNGIQIPGKKIVIDIKPKVRDNKYTQLLDTPIALAILKECGKISQSKDCFVVGELGLNGEARYDTIMQDIANVHFGLIGDTVLLLPKNEDKKLQSGPAFFSSLKDLFKSK